MKLWRELERRWNMHSHAFQVRALALFAVVALFAVLKVATHGGGDQGADPALQLVPADAYAYAHVDLEAEGSGATAARDLVRRAAGPAAEALAGPGISVAEVPGPGGVPQTLVIAEPDDPAKARSFLASELGPGTVTDERGGFVLAGRPSAVDAAVRTDADSSASLASDEVADEVRASLPGDRIGDLYVSQDGFGVLEQKGGTAASLDTFADFAASDGLAAALVGTDDGLSLQMSSLLDPERAAADPSFFSAFPQFEPSLGSLFDPHTLAFLTLGDPAQTVGGLLEQADAVEPGIASAFNRLNTGLKENAGIDLTKDVLPALGDQMAIGVAGRKVTVAFDGVDEDEARTAVARLAVPLISGVNPSRTGRAPTVEQGTVDGVRVIEIHVSPGLTVAIAAFDGHLVVTSDPQGVKRAIEGGEGLDLPSGEVSALLFLDLKGLVANSKPLGLTEIGGYRRYRGEIAKLGTLVVSVRSDEDSLDTDISLQIDQGDDTK